MNVSRCVPSFLLAAAMLILAQSMHSATLRGTELQKQATALFKENMRRKLASKPWIADHRMSSPCGPNSTHFPHR